VSSLRSNTAWNLAGTVAYALCQWCLLAVIARNGTAHQVGLFSLSLAITAPVMLCSNLQLRSLLATDATGEYRIGHYLAVRLFTIAIAMAAIAVLAAGAGGEQTAVIMAVALTKAIEALSEIVYGVLQRHERMQAIAGSLIAKGLLGLGGMWLGLRASGDIFTGVMAMAAGWALVLVAYDIPQAARMASLAELRPAWQRSLLLRLAKAAVPMGLVALLLSLNANLPCYFIEAQLGTAALGRFTALSYLLVAGNLVIMALGNAVSPRLADYHATGQPARFRALLRRVLLICLAVGAAGVAASATLGDLVLTLAYGPGYAGSSDVLVLLTIGMAITWIASSLGFAVTAARRLTVQLPIAALSTIACFAANAWLVPAHGLVGAAWSGIVMASVLAAGYVAIAARVARVPAPAEPVQESA
jgi:O-antigen/teichoic acid export membrane protein